MHSFRNRHPESYRPHKPGDTFGQCPECGEGNKLRDGKWTCDHCGHVEPRPTLTARPLTPAQGAV